MTDPHVIAHGGIALRQPDGTTTTMRCTDCGATNDLQIRGELGDPATVTCPAGHNVPFPEHVDRRDALLQLAGEPGVRTHLPEKP